MMEYSGMTMEQQEKAQGAEISGSGSGAAVPVLPEAKSKAKRLRKVSDVRDQLVGRGGSEQKPQGRQMADKGTWTFYVGLDGHWYLRVLDQLVWRSPFRKPEGWGASIPVKPDHNPKTCRIYGCLACQVKKEKP